MKVFLFFLLATIVATLVAKVRDFLASRDYAKRGWSAEGLSKSEIQRMAAVWSRVGYRKTTNEAKALTQWFLNLKEKDQDLTSLGAPKGFVGHFRLFGNYFSESMDETLSLHQDSPFGSIRRMARLTMEGALVGYGIFITVCLIGMSNQPIPGFDHNWTQLMAKYCSLPWGIAVATTGYLAGLGLCLLVGLVAMAAGIFGAIGAYLHNLICLIPSKA